MLPFSLMSQTPLIEPSWELSLGKPTNLEYQVPIEYRQPTGFVEMDDGCFLICLVNIMNNHIGIGGDNSKIMKLNSDGELLHEIVLPYGEDYNVLYMQLDIWNDTVNVFTLLVDVNNGDAVVMHTYLLDDLSVSEHNEIKRIEFAEFDEQQVGYNLFRILIDDKGYRTFYIELPTIISGDTFVKLLKFDDKLNLICESSTYNKKNDLNWNEYAAKDLAIGIGKQAGYAALQGAIFCAKFVSRRKLKRQLVLWDHTGSGFQDGGKCVCTYCDLC